MVTREALARACAEAGACGSEILHAHSSLSAFGRVDGGAKTVIAALADVAGTVSMPAMCQRDGERRFETWDISNSPSDVGLITETFRTMPGTLRSDHPTASVCARGPLAAALTDGHSSGRQRPGPWGGYAFGHNSPWERLVARNARVVLLGVTFMRNTLVHYLEHRVAEEALSRSPDMRDGLMDWNMWEGRLWCGFDRLKLQDMLDGAGLISKARCGEATILSYSAGDMVAYALPRMLAAPREWFGADFCEWYKRAMEG